MREKKLCDILNNPKLTKIFLKYDKNKNFVEKKRDVTNEK